MLRQDKYIVRFFAVGNASKGGDAILIELFDDDTPFIMLIDGGYAETGDKICAYLKQNYTNPKIDVIFNTHPDIDHISGIKQILTNKDVSIDILCMNRPWKDSGFTTEFFKDGRITEKSLIERIKKAFVTANEIESLAKEKDICLLPLFSGPNTIFDFLTILGPSKKLYQRYLLASDKTPESIFDELNRPYVPQEMLEEDYNEDSEEITWIEDENTSAVNQTSMIIAVNIGHEKFLFTGDAGKEAINSALDYYLSLNPANSTHDFTVVQLPHHGSRKNIDPEIISRLSPKYYIISCPPNGEKEGHPSRRLINKILEIDSNSEIYVTKGQNFVIYKGVNIKADIQQSQKKYRKMDGRPRNEEK